MRTEQVLGLVPARLYQRRDMNCCCICRLGETLGGGLATVRVDGSTMGMALRVRWASGWCSLVWELFCWKPTGVYGFGAVDRTNEGVGCSWCCRGDCSGDPLDSEERSEPDEWMDCRSSSVSRWNGQNISSSSMSNERAASKSRLYAMRVGGSTLNSLGVRTWRNCLLCC
jgi:hypothetical protein